MATLSVAMIAYNEGDVIGRALDSVRWADEVVLVDCGSSDATRLIALENGARIIETVNEVNLNINKNRAIDACSSDWVLVLDADEWISDPLAGAIRTAVNDGVADAYRLPRRNWVLGRWIKRAGEYPDFQIRLFRRGKGRFPARHIHERLAVEGKIKTLTEPLDHSPYPNLDVFIRKNIRDARFEADYLYASGHRASSVKLFGKLLFQIPVRIFVRLIVKGGIFDGSAGLIRALFDGINQMLRWIRIWELSQKHEERKAK